MPGYIISSHAWVDFSKQITVPKGVTISFYQRFGSGMKNSKGMLIQSALTNPQHPNAQDVMSKYKSVSLYNGGSKIPIITLKGDYSVFKSGIVRIEDNCVVKVINKDEQMAFRAVKISGDDAIGLMRQYGKMMDINIHCLFCLG